MLKNLARAIGAGAVLACLTTSANAAFDMKFAKGPCPLVPDSVITKTFKMPANTALEHMNMKLGGLHCGFDWKDKHNMLAAKITFEEAKSVKSATGRFERSTRSMTAQDMAKASEALRKQLEKSGQSSSRQATGNAVIDTTTRKPIVFEDVQRVGDEARYNPDDEGTLVVRKGKDIYRFTAYYGPQMTGSRNLENHGQWTRDTQRQRKQQAVELARAVLKARH